MKRVAIIILNYNGMKLKFNGKSILQLCLNSLGRTQYDNYRVVVQDDHSTDNSVKFLESKDVDIIALEKNINHFSKQNNIAIRYSIKKFNPDYFVLLNDDIIVNDRNWLSKLVYAAERTGAGVIGCSFVSPAKAKERAQQNESYDSKIEEVKSVMASCIMISREALEKVGLLDEGFLTAWEDVDYCLRVRAAGLKVIRNNQVALIHLEGFSTIQQKIKSMTDWRFYGDLISRIHFIRKHYQTPVFREKIVTILDYFGSCVMQRYAMGQKKAKFGFALKDRKLWRVKEAVRVLVFALTHKSLPTQKDFLNASEQ
jgi:hypothetical protein